MAMTPEERARAAAITEEISREAKARRSGTVEQKFTIPGISKPPPTPKKHALRYTVIFSLALAVNIAAFIGYRHHVETELQEAEAARLAEARARAAAVVAAAKQIAEPIPVRLPQVRYQTVRTEVTRQPEYNVYTEQRPATQRRPVVQKVTAPQQQAPEPKKQDRSPEHQRIARLYLAGKKYLDGKITSCEQVPGWEGRYRTQLEVARSSGSVTSPTARKFEILTQETDGKITVIDFTTKGY
jgi:hypothetical protein